MNKAYGEHNTGNATLHPIADVEQYIQHDTAVQTVLDTAKKTDRRETIQELALMIGGVVGTIASLSSETMLVQQQVENGSTTAIEVGGNIGLAGLAVASICAIYKSCRSSRSAF